VRLRGERLERPFAHLYETGGMRRVYLRGHTNILKRVLIHAGGFNLGLLMRAAAWRRHAARAAGRVGAVVATLWGPTRWLWALVARHDQSVRDASLIEHPIARSAVLLVGQREIAFTTGC
jgi:transposase